MAQEIPRDLCFRSREEPPLDPIARVSDEAGRLLLLDLGMAKIWGALGSSLRDFSYCSLG